MNLQGIFNFLSLFTRLRTVTSALGLAIIPAKVKHTFMFQYYRRVTTHLTLSHWNKLDLKVLLSLGQTVIDMIYIFLGMMDFWTPDSAILEHMQESFTSARTQISVHPPCIYPHCPCIPIGEAPCSCRSPCNTQQPQGTFGQDMETSVGLWQGSAVISDKNKVAFTASAIMYR